MILKKAHLDTILGFIHHHFLTILLIIYGLSAVAPTPGLWLRAQSLGSFRWLDGSTIVLSSPFLMLSILLFNAGLGIQLKDLKQLSQKPFLLGAGLLANLLIPILMILFFEICFQGWHSVGELQNLMVGLALVASMPIAGSSSAWSQNINGNMALSLGLVVFSTILSPLTTPMVLNIVSALTIGDYSEDLHELAAQGAGDFLTFSVIIPCLLGIIVNALLGQERLSHVRPWLKALNTLNILLLSYINAALVLPKTFTHPDWDFLLLVGVLSTALCFVAFFAGWLIPHLAKAPQEEKVAMIFGLGMNNNGTGLVLSSIAFADHPLVMLPILFYNLAQQLGAAFLTQWFSKASD